MNRELKFRVWNKSTKSWLNDDAGTHCWGEYCLNIFTGEVVEIVTTDNKFFSRDSEPNFYFDKNTHVKESPYVVQQYTGCYDKNRTPIYEGDILAADHDGGEDEANIGVVYFAAGTYMIDGDGPFFDHVYGHSPDILDNHTVIGNKFENPELLKR